MLSVRSHTRTHMLKHSQTYINMRRYAHRIWVWVHIYTHTHMHVHIHTHKRIIYVQIHTHTHTNIEVEEERDWQSAERGEKERGNERMHRESREKEMNTHIPSGYARTQKHWRKRIHPYGYNDPNLYTRINWSPNIRKHIDTDAYIVNRPTNVHIHT